MPELVTLASPWMSPPCAILIVPELVMTLLLTGVTGLVASFSNSSLLPTLTVPALVRMESAPRSKSVPMVSDEPVSSLSSGGMVSDLASRRSRSSPPNGRPHWCRS